MIGRQREDEVTRLEEGEPLPGGRLRASRPIAELLEVQEFQDLTSPGQGVADTVADQETRAPRFDPGLSRRFIPADGVARLTPNH